jgi:hypothetical protein
MIRAIRIRIANESRFPWGARADTRWLALVAAIGCGWLGCQPSTPISPTPALKAHAPENETLEPKEPSKDQTTVATRNEVAVKHFNLHLDHAPMADEAVQARVTVGSLPIGAKLIVRTPDGNIAGTIVNFGPKGPGETSIHSVAIPERAISDRHVTLRLEIQAGSSEASRAPTDSEVTKVEAVVVESTTTKVPAP